MKKKLYEKKFVILLFVSCFWQNNVLFLNKIALKMNKNIIFLLLIALFVVPTVSAQTVNEGTPRFRIAVQGGYGYRLGKYQDTGQSIVDQHNKRLKKGFVYGADMNWFTASDMGFGLKYSNMHSKSEDMVTITYDNGTVESGEYTDMVDLRFIGPTFASRYVSQDNRCIFLLDFGLGYLSYTDNGRVIHPMSIKGGTLGFCADAGVDFRLMNSIYLGATFSMIGGTLSSYNYTENGNTSKVELEKDHYETLTHVTLTIGFRLYL